MKLPLTLLSTVLLSACAAQYVPQPGEATARVNIRETGHLMICHAGKKYSVWPEMGSDYAILPANVPVSVFVNRTVGGTVAGAYSVTYNCSPRLGISLIPDSSYFLNFEIQESKCRLELYQESVLSPVRLRPIFPLTAQNC
jgi:hypothetical protein